jgi:hypothetical protein
MQWLLVRTLNCVLFLTLLCAGTLGIARALPIATSVKLLHLDDCQLPCWIGIIPQKTSLTVAKARLYEVYRDESDIVISYDPVSDMYTISSKLYGKLMLVSFVYFGKEDAPISKLIIDFDDFDGRPFHLQEIFPYLPEIPYVYIGDPWVLRFPTWSLQGVRMNYECGKYNSIRANDFIAVLTLGEPLPLTQYYHKWHGFRKCYFPSELDNN